MSIPCTVRRRHRGRVVFPTCACGGRTGLPVSGFGAEGRGAGGGGQEGGYGRGILSNKTPKRPLASTPNPPSPRPLQHVEGRYACCRVEGGGGREQGGGRAGGRC